MLWLHLSSWAPTSDDGAIYCGLGYRRSRSGSGGGSIPAGHHHELPDGFNLSISRADKKLWLPELGRHQRQRAPDGLDGRIAGPDVLRINLRRGAVELGAAHHSTHWLVVVCAAVGGRGGRIHVAFCNV